MARKAVKPQQVRNSTALPSERNPYRGAFARVALASAADASLSCPWGDWQHQRSGQRGSAALAYVMLKRLRVHALPSGELVTNRRETKRPEIDEGWWRDVLLDPRARVPTDISISEDSPHARYRLDRQREDLMVACPCGRGGMFNRDKLIAQVGGGMNVIHLARELIDCGTRNKLTNHCRAYVIR